MEHQEFPVWHSLQNPSLQQTKGKKKSKISKALFHVQKKDEKSQQLRHYYQEDEEDDL